MFLHSGLAIKSSTDSLKTQIFQQNRLSGMSAPMGGEGKQRSRVEQLDLEMRRSCGGMRARSAMTLSSWLKIRTHKVLMREMRRLQWWRYSCGCMSKIRACVPPSSRVCCLSPLSRYFPFKSSDCVACSASSNERASQDISVNPGWNQKPSFTGNNIR